MKTSFIGHRFLLPNDIEQRVKSAIENEIKLNCNSFIVGSHGEFDKIVLGVLLSLKESYPQIKIEVVTTNLNSSVVDTNWVIKQKPKYEMVMFEIEELHYKQRIGASNKQMIDECDTLICYVKPNSWRSGAKTALAYAVKKKLRINNLYLPEDECLESN